MNKNIMPNKLFNQVRNPPVTPSDTGYADSAPNS